MIYRIIRGRVVSNDTAYPLPPWRILAESATGLTVMDVPCGEPSELYISDGMSGSSDFDSELSRRLVLTEYGEWYPEYAVTPAEAQEKKKTDLFPLRFRVDDRGPVAIVSNADGTQRSSKTYYIHKSGPTPRDGEAWLCREVGRGRPGVVFVGTSSRAYEVYWSIETADGWIVHFRRSIDDPRRNEVSLRRGWRHIAGFYEPAKPPSLNRAEYDAFEPVVTSITLALDAGDVDEALQVAVSDGRFVRGSRMQRGAAQMVPIAESQPLMD